MHMILILYLVLLIVGQSISVGVGLLLDPISKTAALATFIPLYYAMFWIAWRITLLLADRTPAEQSNTTTTESNPVLKAIWLLAPVGLVAELCD